MHNFAVKKSTRPDRGSRCFRKPVAMCDRFGSPFKYFDMDCLNRNRDTSPIPGENLNVKVFFHTQDCVIKKWISACAEMTLPGLVHCSVE